VTDPQLVKYYKLRAKEYDKLYARPDRQDALREASGILQNIFRDKNVFEIACGTGYWTEQISRTAKSILATDINDEMIEVAKTKNYSPAPVRFENRNYYDVSGEEKHDNLFAGFVWSHIPLQECDGFIDTISAQVKSGGTVVFIDNRFAEGSNLPIAETDEHGNTFQIRTLENGQQHRVLKNFPDEAFFKALLSHKARSVKFTALPYYWILEYQTI
jgi:2-polyprenyl-3-methyl-5-hydroxy-6-metoxy-1,4-benzoquinol methylase